MRHDLVTPGAWVELREYAELRAKHRKRALAGRVGATTVDPATQRPLPMETRLMVISMMDYAEDIAAMLVSSWSIPYLPGVGLPGDDPSLIGELSIEDNNRLLELTEPTRKLLVDGPPTPDPGDAGDPASPTPPVSDSPPA